MLRSKMKTKANRKRPYSGKLQNSTTQALWVKYAVILCFIIVAFILLLIITYHIFEYGNPTSVTRPDWLAFWGAYLTAFASVLLSMIALFQTQKYNEQENKRRAKERHQNIQPIFSIEEHSNMMQSVHRMHYLKENQRPDDPPPVIETITSVNFIIKNAGQFPITNVIIFDYYIKACVGPGEVIKLSVSYDEPDDNRDVLFICESAFERKNNYPSWFNINYEDADGTDMIKTFESKEFDGVQYYTLTDTEIV